MQVWYILNLGPDIIKEICNFAYYFNKTDITPMVLDGGHEIILANCPDDTHVICNINNDIPVKIPSHPYDINGFSNNITNYI